MTNRISDRKQKNSKGDIEALASELALKNNNKVTKTVYVQFKFL